MSDDLVIGDMGLSMEEAEDLITELGAENKAMKTELARLRKPSIWKRFSSVVNWGNLITVLLIIELVGAISLGSYGVYYGNVIKPNRLSDEAAAGPTLTEEQLIDYANSYIYNYWDEKQVVHIECSDKYLHLNPEDYKIIKSLRRIDLAGIAAIRELKRLAREKVLPVQNKPRAEY